VRGLRLALPPPRPPAPSPNSTQVGRFGSSPAGRGKKKKFPEADHQRALEQRRCAAERSRSFQAGETRIRAHYRLQVKGGAWVDAEPGPGITTALAGKSIGSGVEVASTGRRIDDWASGRRAAASDGTRRLDAMRRGRPRRSAGDSAVRNAGALRDPFIGSYPQCRRVRKLVTTGWQIASACPHDNRTHDAHRSQNSEQVRRCRNSATVPGTDCAFSVWADLGEQL